MVARRVRTIHFVLAALGVLSGCSQPPKPPPPAPVKHASQAVFEATTPSVVAILNDDRDDRDAAVREALENLKDENNAPKKVIDISLRKEPMPHGTGFMVEGNRVVTAAHVVFRPDKLRITTRAGKTVEAELVSLDEVRDVAVLRPKEPLPEVPPINLYDGETPIGDKVWALGHTGQGMWALSWGISEGVASGVVDMVGAKLLLFDAAVYPGFSGGPVVTRDSKGAPRVIGVNHAILWTGERVASISSATSISDLRDVLDGKPHPIEAKLAAYAREKRSTPTADVFVTDSLNIFRDPHGQQIASIYGNVRTLHVIRERAYVPVVAMLFHLPPGKHDVTFELRDPTSHVVNTTQRTVEVTDHQRVSFSSAAFDFNPKASGHYDVFIKVGGKPVGSTEVALDLPDDDNNVLDSEQSRDSVIDENPDVDIVVASSGWPDPLRLSGIQASWNERSYPRRVGFTWFARGTRGWSGTNVAISAYVLDQKGHIVGHSIGCFRPEIRPEFTWACLGSGGSPLVDKEGEYDVVFAINDRPVGMWPMEAAIRADTTPGSDVERWFKELKRAGASKGTTASSPPASDKKDDKKKDPPKPAPKK
jgi:S1-C subfamily serine protease